MVDSWRCVCLWPECEGLYESIRNADPQPHVWNANPVRIRFTRNKRTRQLPPRAEALFQGMLQYFPTDITKVIDNEQESLPICLHHFPAALLEWKGERSNSDFKVPIASADIRKIQHADKRYRMGERSNTFLFLCRKRLKTKAQHRTYKGLYVQTPMEDLATVRDFVTSLEGGGSCEVPQVDENGGTVVTRSSTRKGIKGGKKIVTPIIASLKSPSPLTDVTNCQDTKVAAVSSEVVGNGQNLSTPSLTQKSPTDDNASSSSNALSGLLSRNHLMTSPPRLPGSEAFVPPRSASKVDEIDGGSCDIDANLDAEDATLEFHVLTAQPSTALVPPRYLPLPMSVLECQMALKSEFSAFTATVSKQGSEIKVGAPLCNQFSQFGAVKIVSHLLLTHFHSKVRFPLLHKGMWYCPCNNEEHGTECTYFSIRTSDLGDRDIYCSSCAATRLVEKSKQRRWADDPQRCRPVTKDTPALVLYEVATKRQRDNNCMHKKMKRLLDKLKAPENDTMVVSSGSSVHTVVREAVKYVECNMKSSRQELLRALLEIEMEDGKASGSSTEGSTSKQKREEFVHHILNSITNMSKRLNGKESQCRYSPHMLNAALALFIRSGSAYEELRESNVVCLPSPRRLRTIGSKLKVKEGGDPSLYFQFQQELKDAQMGDVMGHLMVDEIKLKNGIAFNSNSNVVVGFVEDAFNLRHIYEQVLRGDDDIPGNLDEEGTDTSGTKKEDDGGTAVVYANQWRFRTTRGVVHNGDFFFNGGSLSGNEMIRQFTQVVKSYEFIGVKVMGLVCDAGGGNASFLKILRKNRKVEGPWPDAECVSLPNPVDQNRFIFVWTCSTHGLKALRNSLYKSQDQLARDFIRGDVMFGWRTIEDCFRRDLRRREEHGLEPRTDLERHGVFLDHYTVMNCRLAKQPFSERTIAALIRHAAVSLGVRLDWNAHHPSQWHKFHSFSTQLKRAASESQNAEAKSTVCTIEFLVAIHGVFIERLLNRHFRFTKDNIAAEKRNLADAMQYFTDWVSEREELEANRGITDKRESMQHYPAPQTYENLLLTVAGFVAYSEAILEMETEATAYVPALHSNQSSIEAFFSQVRRQGRDRPDVYGGGVVRQNTLNTIKANYKRRKLGNNNMYPVEDRAMEYSLGTTVAHVTRLSAATFLHSETCKRLQECGRDGVDCCILPQDFAHAGTAFGYLLGDHFRSQKLAASPNFQHFCLEDEKFSGFFLLSIHAPVANREWFERFCSKDQEDEVNELCRKMIGCILHVVEESLDAKRSTNESSLESAILTFAQSGRLAGLVADYGDEILNNATCNVVLLDFLKEKVLRQWLPEAIRRYRAQLRPRIGDTPIVTCDSTSGPNGNHGHEHNLGCDENVNRFVGWALWSVLKRYKAKLSRGIPDMTTEKMISDSIAMLQDMKVVEAQILGNREYITRFYPLDDAIRNKGTLTLVSPAYIEEFSKLSQYMGQKVSLQSVKVHARSGKVKDELSASMVKDGMIETLDKLLDTSEARTPQLDMSRVRRKKVILEMFEKMSNAKIGSVIRQYRSDYLTRRNDTAHRTKLSVLSKSSNYK